MRLYQLMARLDWKQLEQSLVRLYPDSAEHLPDFAVAYRQLQLTEPLSSDMILQIIPVEEDMPGSALHVYGCNGSRVDVPSADNSEEAPMARFNLSATDWAEWLGMRISPAFLAVCPTDELVTHCLWEMTYYGFSPEAIRQRIRHSTLGAIP